MSRFLGIVEIVMRDRRAGTIQQKSYAAIFPLVQRSLTSLTAEPALTQSANASRVATREVKALLLLNHVAAIQVECRERAAGSGGGGTRRSPGKAGRQMQNEFSSPISLGNQRMNGTAHDNSKPAAASRIMTRAAQKEFGYEEIAHLAYLNWQKDGCLSEDACPSGRALDYWLDAECQLKATWHLLVAASAAADAAEAIEEIRLRELAVAFAGDNSAAAEAKPCQRAGRSWH